MSIELAEKYVDAYNRADFDALKELVTEDVHVIHHNRGVEVTGRDNVVELYKGYGGAFPDRSFYDRRGISELADGRVLIEHSWGGTAAADVPGWAATGEKIGLEIVTFLTFSDGKIADYHDFG